MTDATFPLRPLRWLAHLPLAILPFLAAAVLEAPRVSTLLARKVEDRLAAAGQGWARVTADGRDIEIRGSAPDHAAADAAFRLATATPGVRSAVLHIRVGGA